MILKQVAGMMLVELFILIWFSIAPLSGPELITGKGSALGIVFIFTNKSDSAPFFFKSLQ